MQVDLYNGRKTVVVVVSYSHTCSVSVFTRLYCTN